MSAGLTIAVDEQKKVDVLVEAGKGNTAANLTVSLLHHLRQLKGMIPTSLQVTNTFVHWKIAQKHIYNKTLISQLFSLQRRIGTVRSNSCAMLSVLNSSIFSHCSPFNKQTVSTGGLCFHR